MTVQAARGFAANDGARPPIHRPQRTMSSVLNAEFLLRCARRSLLHTQRIVLGITRDPPLIVKGSTACHVPRNGNSQPRCLILIWRLGPLLPDLQLERFLADLTFACFGHRSLNSENKNCLLTPSRVTAEVVCAVGIVKARRVLDKSLQLGNCLAETVLHAIPKALAVSIVVVIFFTSFLIFKTLSPFYPRLLFPPVFTASF